MDFQRYAFFDAAAWSGSDTGRVPPKQFLVLRYGKNVFTKSGKRGEFEFSEADANAIIAEFISRGRDLVIDFEHQSLGGGKAPAAGWIDRLIKTSGGLAACVKYWTDEAAGFIRNGEYRYFSPTLYFSRSGKNVSALHSVALTNHPAMHSIPALAAHDTVPDDAVGNADLNSTLKTSNINKVIMNDLLALAELHGFDDQPEGAQHDALAEMIRSAVETQKQLRDFLSAHGFNDLDDATRMIRSAPSADEFTRMQNELRRRNADSLVAKAFADRKLAEVQRGWANDFAARDPQAFAAWADSAPVCIPPNHLPDCGPMPAAQSSPAPQELKIFRTLGLDPANLNLTERN